jgi:ornithine carbamoyltransferase
LRKILNEAGRLKAERAGGGQSGRLAGRTLAMVFEKNSTRTRVSFEVGMSELGGHALFLTGRDMQLGRGETVADTARVLSRYVHAIMLRCHQHEMLEELAAHATVPVINGLSDHSHPCQLMADVMTFEEHRGPIGGRPVAWVGDGNNVANSLIEAAVKFDFPLRIATPASLRPSEKLCGWAKQQRGKVEILESPQDAVRGAHLVMTDTWISMGDTDSDMRLSLLAPYQVNAALMKLAAPDALFMHCLPAHRGEEVSTEVLESPNSVVWDEAENRLHVQKAILLWCMGKL